MGVRERNRRDQLFVALFCGGLTGTCALRCHQQSVRDGTRAVANALTDGTLVPGAGGFETLAHADLMKYKATVAGRAKLGIAAYAEALLTIPKTLAENAGYDAQDSMLKLLEEESKGSAKVPHAKHRSPRDELGRALVTSHARGHAHVCTVHASCGGSRAASARTAYGVGWL